MGHLWLDLVSEAAKPEQVVLLSTAAEAEVPMVSGAVYPAII